MVDGIDDDREVADTLNVKQEFNGMCSDEEEVDMNIEQETRKVAQKIEHRPPFGQDEVVDGQRAGSTTCCQT